MGAGSTLYLNAGRITGSGTVNGDLYLTKAGYLGNAPDDINSLSSATPASDDVLLLEDQSDSWNKKKAAISSFAVSNFSTPGGTTNYLRADGSWANPPGARGNTFEYEYDSSAPPVDG